MVAYFDENLTWSDYAKLGCGLTEDRSGFEPEQIRQKATNAEEYSADRLFRYVVRPFDTRWCYVTMVPHLWNRPRPTFWPNIWEGNRFLLFRPRAAASPEGIPAFYSKHAGEQDTIRGHAYFFPFYLKKHFRFSVATKPDLLTSIDTEIDDSQTASNLSLDAEKYLERLDCLVELDSAATIWYHVLAICYAPAYLTENKDGVQLDWPRVPLPDSKERLLASAELGKQLAALLDPEESIMGITEAPRSEFKTLGILRRTDSKSVSPRDLAVTAGWGHFGKDDVVMPGSGKSESRSYTADEWQNLLKTGLDENSLRALLGKNTLDIYLNDTTYWSNVPEHVWEYVIGGYQVIKKWLSYREEKILGRALSLDEAEYVSQMIRRIAAILLLQPQLDENYQAVKSTTWAWNIEVPAAMPADEIEIDDS